MHVAVAGILIIDGRVLLGRRSAARRHYPACWDLPGGHVLEGESTAAALVRELQEELAIDVVALDPGPVQRWEIAGRTPEDDYDLTLWRVRSWRGDVTNAAPHEHERLAWCTGEELRHLALAHTGYRAVLARMLEAERT